MLLNAISISLEQVSAVISIGTPIILLLWFYYSQKQTLSKDYFSEVDGIYAGFTDPIHLSENTPKLNSGIILNIRDTDDKGYFVGEFDFAESLIDVIDNRLYPRKIRDGVHMFLGKLDFKMYRDRSRHPFRPKENRTYRGILYIADRLDFSFEEYKIENYLSAEYDIIHYREMKTLKCTLRINHKPEGPELPKEFTLYKKMEMGFEPYKNVKEAVFFGDTRADR